MIKKYNKNRIAHIVTNNRVHTTNACEHFRSDFNSNFYHQHLHIFKTIELSNFFK